MVTVPIIDEKRCTLCGRCVDVCPKQVLAILNGRISVSVDECMLCSHCYSVCLYNAIRFDPDALANSAFKSFLYNEKMCPPGSFSAAELVNFVRSRRSVREFRPDPVGDETLSDLVEFGVTAPSGSNCQNWEFLVINGRDRVWKLALEIKKFFLRLNRLAGNPLVRYLSLPLTGKALIRYYNEHMESVEMALRESEAGRDLLFHSAPALIILHSDNQGSTPLEDAQYASYNITLLAHALGLGTCYIGYAVESINRALFIKDYLGIPHRNRIRAVLAVGYPEVSFEKPALRKKYRARFL
ncbi:MAG: nitroreductase family protein [Spirochaetes bacterium]|nr:nitroreductase family protein [Spirochaetota bacterium]